ncbi:MAG TPA: DNA-3-methyladenine glycosylase [Acidobacteriota bacterium]|nr:DNA-3-methyladenine glycosylase [Acidobacteriota bacterium]
MHVEQCGDLEQPSCDVTLSGEVCEEDRDWAAETVRWILHDHCPLEDFYSHITAADPSFPLAASARGLRTPLSPTLFETLVFAIVGQQVNLTFAYHCKAALEAGYTRCAIIDGQEYLAALTPEDLDGAQIPDLRAQKISNAKSRAILELAESFRSEPLDRRKLAGKSSEEISALLTSFRGIGPWTAAYSMIKALGTLDVLPCGDAGLQNAVKRWRGMERKPTSDEVHAIGERWGPYKALATFYLWTGLIEQEKES